MRILILGGGYAGILAALRLANRKVDAEITLVNAEAEFVERVRNHELGAGMPPPRRKIASLLHGTNVHSVVARVVSLDLERQFAHFGDGNELAWDRLVYALGSVADDGGIRGAREHAMLLGDETGARRLSDALRAGDREVVVVGGGLSGVEIAAELAERGAKVTLTTDGGLGSFLSTQGQDYLRRTLIGMNVKLLEKKVLAVQPDQILLDGESVRGICVWAIGFRAPSLAREAGLAVNARGQILVGEQLRSLSHPNVYAVGDAAEPSFDAGSPIRMGCKYAMPMAAHAADNLSRSLRGQNERSFRFGDTGFCISLGRRDGLVQLSRRDGAPAGIWTGRFAAWVKELVVRYTIWSLRLERHLVFYRWLAPPKRALTANEDETKRLTA